MNTMTSGQLQPIVAPGAQPQWDLWEEYHKQVRWLQVQADAGILTSTQYYVIVDVLWSLLTLEAQRLRRLQEEAHHGQSETCKAQQAVADQDA
jgi:hypothetical protein